MEKPGVDCSRKICSRTLPAGLGRVILRQGWESSCSELEVVAWWDLEGEYGNCVHPFPGKNSFSSGQSKERTKRWREDRESFELWWHHTSSMI